MNNQVGEKLSLDERIAQIDKSIEEYTNGLGLPSRNKATMTEVEVLLDKSRSDMMKMTQEEAAASSIFLSSFNYYLQKSLNKEARMVSYCEESIRRLITSRVAQQRGASYQERVNSAISEDEVAKKLDTLKVLANLRLSETAYLVNRIQEVASSYKGLGMIRKGQNS